MRFFWYIHGNFYLNPHIIHGDMKENVSGRFFLNTVYTFLLHVQPNTTIVFNKHILCNIWYISYTCI